MRLTESLLSGCPCREQPDDMAELTALFTLATVSGMLAHVVALEFHSLQSLQMAMLHA